MDPDPRSPPLDPHMCAAYYLGFHLLTKNQVYKATKGFSRGGSVIVSMFVPDPESFYQRGSNSDQFF